MDDCNKPLLDPENFHEAIDFERIPLEEVFEQLLTYKKHGYRFLGQTCLRKNQENKYLKVMSFMWNPLYWVMEAAALMAIALANGGGESLDWQVFAGIICLLLINSTISFIEDNAGNAAAALKARLAPKTRVLRDGQRREVDAVVLVPGDIISIKLGDIIAADACLLEGDPLKIDQI